MTLRGKIHSPRRAKQLHDFSGLSIGTITPTDLDLLLDYHDESFVFGEIKGQGAAMGVGQETAAVRVVNAVAAGGKRAVLFEIEHLEPNPDRTIDVSRCFVRRTYFQGRWRDRTGKAITVREAIDRFLGLQPVQVPIDPPAAPVIREVVETPAVDQINWNW